MTEQKKVLVIGKGGREHALVWKIAQSPQVSKIYCAPGNPGIGEIAELVDITTNDIESLADFAQEKGIDITIVGPEDPLVLGVVDEFQKRGLAILGPHQEAAQLESSKIFSKAFFNESNIPTAKHFKFIPSSLSFHYLEYYIQYIISAILREEFGDNPLPFVVKMDGLASGKGVQICREWQDLYNFMERVNPKEIEKSYPSLIFEEFLKGEEITYIVMIDPNGNILPWETSQDYKTLYDGNQGPNTGGMGAYSPAPIVTPELEQKILEKIVYPTIKEMSMKRILYSGFLYFGLMISEGEPCALELNVRLGDPETQPLLYRLKTDLMTLIEAALKGDLNEQEMIWDPKPAMALVLASPGYPNDPKNGIKIEIEGVEKCKNKRGEVFHSGTARDKEGNFEKNF